MHVHFDADLLVYRAGFAAEKQQWDIIDAGGGLVATFESKRRAEAEAEHINECGDVGPVEVCKGDRVAEPVENALHNVRSLIEDTMEKLGVTEDEITLYLTGPTNFREGVATLRPYKGNRDEAHKPVHGPAIKEFMHKHWNVVVSDDEEADDVVGYSHYRMWLHDEQASIIATVDKDLDMIPGMHYNFVKEDSYYVGIEEADRWFWTQLLMGDATDNIPGIPGVGIKKAQAILEDVEGELCTYKAVRAAYEESYGEDADDALLENARLLWIRRQPNEWWVPPYADED
jgi:DNA polymerase-1